MKIKKTLCVHADSTNPLSEKSYFAYGQPFLSAHGPFIKVADVEVTFEIDLKTVVAQQVTAITTQIDEERKAFHLKVTALEAARNNLLCLEA